MKTNLIGLIMSCLAFLSLPAYCIIGGQTLNNGLEPRVFNLRLCSYSQHGGGKYSHSNPCRDLNSSTSFSVASDRILTAAHSLWPLYKNKKLKIKLMQNDKQVSLLTHEKDFTFALPQTYIKKMIEEEKKDKCEQSSPSCDFDIAVIKLTRKGREKLNLKHFFNIDRTYSHNNVLSGQVLLYGYGVYYYDFYSGKKRTAKSLFNYMLGGCSSKTFVKKKKSDFKLRYGLNWITNEADNICYDDEICPEEMNQSTFKIYSTVKNKNFYNVYAGSGDSGGPALLNGQVVGLTCALSKKNMKDQVISNVFLNLSSPHLQSFFNQNL